MLWFLLGLIGLGLYTRRKPQALTPCKKWVKKNVKAVVFCGSEEENVGIQTLRKWALEWELNAHVISLKTVMGSREDAQEARKGLRTERGRKYYVSKMINFCYENMHPSGQIALITDVIHPDLIPLIRLGFEEVFVLHVNSGEQGCIGGPFYDVFKRMADYTTDSESLEVYTSRLEHVFSKYLLPRWFGKMSICQVLSKINKKPNDLLMLADDTVPSLSYMIAASIRLTHGEVDLIVPISATSVALATNIARILRTVTVPVLSPRDYPALDTFRRNRVVMIDDVLTVSQRRRASNVASYLTSETYKILGLYAVKRPMGTENLIPLPFPVKTMIFDMSSKYLYTYDIMTTARFEL